MRRLFITIPTIHERRQYCVPLAVRLSREFGADNVEFYWDLQRSMIHSHPLSWFNGLEKDAEWIAVVEDDIKFEDGLGQLVLERLDEADQLGYQVINLCSQYSADVEALRNGDRWREYKGTFRNEQFLLMRREIVVKFHNYWAALDLATYGSTESDVILDEFFRAEKLRVHIVLPNPVDHLTLKSTLGHPRTVAGRPRVSTTYGMKS